MSCDNCGCAGGEHDCYAGCGGCAACRETAEHDAKHDDEGTECGPFCKI